MNADVLRTLLIFIPLYTAVMGAIVWVIRIRPANRKADEEAAVGQWRRTLEWIGKLESRVEILEQEVERCHRERDLALAGEAKWKAIAEGIGTNRQDEAAMLAAERLADDQRKKGESGE